MNSEIQWDQFDNFGKLSCLASGQTYNQSQFKKLISEKIDDLKSVGISDNARVLLLNNNTADFLAMLFAIWSTGATAVPVDLKIKGHGYDEFIKNYQIKFVYDGKTLEKTSLSTTKSTSELDQIDLILLSSGTTGVSKGIGFKVEHIMNRARAIHKTYGFEGTRALCLLPTSFGHGLVANTLSHFLFGSHVFLSPKFDLGVALNLGAIIDQHEITTFSSVPAFWNLIAASKSKRPQKSSLRQVHCASAFLFSETYKVARSWISNADFYINYGLTECSSWIAGGKLAHDPAKYQVGFVGQPIESNIKISCPDADGVGMVSILSPSIPRKYVGASSDLICDQVTGYLQTGDIGYFKNENLYLTGRVSEFINQGGEKISPLDIEEPAQSHPDILRAVAVPVEHSILGEQIGLIAEVKTGSAITIENLQIYLAKFLPQNKIPKIILFTDKIPLSENSKINRGEIKKYFSVEMKKRK